MNSSLVRFAVVLGLLSAIGPFAIDMYLPALPTIGADFGAGIGQVQMSLMVFFVALGAGQLVYGPFSDMFGRKLPLYIGLVLFMIGSVGCALAPSIETLIAFRFVQGLGACAGTVVPRAVVRDLHTGPEAAKLMSLLMLVFSISPILAPLAGSGVIALGGWRAVFWVVLVAAALGLILLALALPETRPVKERRESSIAGAFAAYGLLLRDRRFLALCFLGAFGVSSFFVYLANSSFVLIDHYGLTPTQYSIAFSVNAVSFFGVAQLNGVLGSRFGLMRLMRFAVTGYAASMVLLVALFLAGFDQLSVMIVLLFIAYGFLGLVVPSSAVIALDDHGAIAGTASALMGTLQFGAGIVMMAVVGLFLDGTAVPMLAGIAACSVIALALAFLTPQRSPALAGAPAE
ncbi:multidrug effflux MFS transporter [Kaistia geumhonensis]|uniref:Bcr/CflA family efflux transporter n=1 Tax=Kaistia geumhonensis TaxID=410839 RepID=A0ABU0MBZ9_9HYPH|nr:multidrug effflux MFS transporter [Kaistia geumhonensis]MCX5481430.1 multidrug effflux MFS transporter [Kaistia geumhonensis]MDQ0518495.1 DHA1 family bicyclomycin/chloramphenicol resistance-like MFS transporter [Kaistia geumhonensis]